MAYVYSRSHIVIMNSIFIHYLDGTDDQALHPLRHNVYTADVT
jgi:hypothetical protein